MRRLGEPTVHRLLNTLMMMVGLWVGLACGGDTDDRMVRRYAKCMTDTNTTLHRLTVSSALRDCSAERRGDGGAVAWSTGERGAHHGEDQGRLRPLL